MANCTRIRRKNRKVCLGDMRDQIQIDTRAIVAPADGSVDFTETVTRV